MTTPLSINNILVSSKMVRRRAILVEGRDDVKKYENIFENSNNVKGKVFNKVLKVYAVETILDTNNEFYQEGCVGVIKATTDLKSNSHNNINDLKKYVLGYIDKDVRNHRTSIEPLPDFDILYMLESYSIETFYVNKFSLKPLINELMSCSKSLITDSLLDHIHEEALRKTIDELYYAVLDSLKKSTDNTYTSAKYGYDRDYGFIKNNDLLNLDEKTSLEEEFFHIGKDLPTYSDVCKGKWLFDGWLENVIEIVLNLRQKCGTGVVIKCDFCKINQPNKCSYKSIVASSNMHATYPQKVFNDQPFLETSLDFNKIIGRFDLMFV